jgi:hypothetical protein
MAQLDGIPDALRVTLYISVNIRFPESQHEPPAFLECTRDQFVALYAPGHFVNPVSSAAVTFSEGFEPLLDQYPAVPEVTVHEHSHLSCGEHEIRAPEDVLRINSVPQTQSMYLLAQADLYRVPRGSDSGHIPAYFVCRLRSVGSTLLRQQISSELRTASSFAGLSRDPHALGVAHNEALQLSSRQ